MMAEKLFWQTNNISRRTMLADEQVLKKGFVVPHLALSVS
jgi:hypothetical protein